MHHQIANGAARVCVVCKELLIADLIDRFPDTAAHIQVILDKGFDQFQFHRFLCPAFSFNTKINFVFFQLLFDAEITFEVLLHPWNDGYFTLIDRGIQPVHFMDGNGPGNIIAKERVRGLTEIIILNFELTFLKPDPCDGFVGSTREFGFFCHSTFFEFIRGSYQRTRQRAECIRVSLAKWLPYVLLQEVPRVPSVHSRPGKRVG